MSRPDRIRKQPNETDMKTTLLVISLTIADAGWYHVQAQSFNNPDFEADSVGFTSDYQFADFNSTEGQFTVRSDPQNWNGEFVNFGDHTTATGKMLAVNGATSGDPAVWRQTISVQPNTSYRFQAWTGTAVAGGPANLILRIDGAQIGSSFVLPDNPGVWTRWEQRWTSSTNVAATFEIINANTSRFPNDFYLDDIGLKTLPELFLKVDSGDVELRWHLEPEWELFTSTSLAPGSWSAVTNIPTQVGTLNVLRLPIESPHAFFRLQRLP